MHRKYYRLHKLGPALVVLMFIAGVVFCFGDQLYDCLPEDTKMKLRQLGPEAAGTPESLF